MVHSPQKYRTEYRELGKLGFPILITQIGIIAVNFADTIMVGQYGTRELASAGFVNNLFLVSIVALVGFAAGMTPIVGAYFGRKDPGSAGEAWKKGLLLNLTVSAAVTALMGGLFFLLPRMNQPPELMSLIEPYYLLILSTVIPGAIFGCCQQTSNGLTDTAMPMWIMIGGNLVNVAGNYLLIFGKFGCPELGLIGAGIATVTARYLMAGAILWVMLTRKRFSAVKEGMSQRRHGDMTKRVWVTSYPIMIQHGVECSLWSVGAVVCGWFGQFQLASYQIVNTIGQLGFMVYLSATIAVSIRVANHTGASDFPGVRNTAGAGMHIVLVLATLTSAILLIFGKDLMRIFTGDIEVISAGLPLFLPLILYQFCDAIQLNFGNALRGTSDVKPLLVVSMVSYLGIGIPAMYLLGVGADMGNVGVYYSFCAALLSASALLYYYFRRAVNKLERGSRDVNNF